jgi:molybdopterin molybdotransferase
VPGLHTFARGVARADGGGRLVVRDTGPQASNLYSSVARANCLVHLPEALEAAPAGTPVEVEWLPWAR